MIKTNPSWNKYQYFKLKTESNLCETSMGQVRQGSLSAGRSHLKFTW